MKRLYCLVSSLFSFIYFHLLSLKMKEILTDEKRGNDFGILAVDVVFVALKIIIIQFLEENLLLRHQQTLDERKLHMS